MEQQTTYIGVARQIEALIPDLRRQIMDKAFAPSSLVFTDTENVRFFGLTTDKLNEDQMAKVAKVAVTIDDINVFDAIFRTFSQLSKGPKGLNILTGVSKDLEPLRAFDYVACNKTSKTIEFAMSTQADCLKFDSLCKILTGKLSVWRKIASEDADSTTKPRRFVYSSESFDLIHFLLDVEPAIAGLLAARGPGKAMKLGDKLIKSSDPLNPHEFSLCLSSEDDLKVQRFIREVIGGRIERQISHPGSPGPG